MSRLHDPANGLAQMSIAEPYSKNLLPPPFLTLFYLPCPQNNSTMDSELSVSCMHAQKI